MATAATLRARGGGPGGRAAHPHHRRPSPSSSHLATGAALASGLLASSCCVLQLALNAASIGCAGFSALTPYRHVFRALTAASLAALAARQGLTDRRTLATAALALALAASSDVLGAANRGLGGGRAPDGSSSPLPLLPLPPLPPLVAAGLRRALAPLDLPPSHFLRAYLDAALVKGGGVGGGGGAETEATTTQAPKRVALRVRGIRCEACAARVKGALLLHGAGGKGQVINATVETGSGEAVVYVLGEEEAEEERARSLVAAIEGLNAGYEVVAVEEEDGGGRVD